MILSSFMNGDKELKPIVDDQQPYTKMSRADGLRHDKHVEELNEKGYFTLEDGLAIVSSCVDVIKLSSINDP